MVWHHRRERRQMVTGYLESMYHQWQLSLGSPKRPQMDTTGKHEIDFYRWTQEQAAALRAVPPDLLALDCGNLAEEVEDMGRGEVNMISSLLKQTLAHLLKISIDSKTQAVNHWYDEATTFQGDAVLAYSPGLKQKLDLDIIWRVARNGATRSLQVHGVAVPVLPDSCPLSLDDLIDPDFDPRKAVVVISAAIIAAQRKS
jgi:hypothetical protein